MAGFFMCFRLDIDELHQPLSLLQVFSNRLAKKLAACYRIIHRFLDRWGRLI